MTDREADKAPDRDDLMAPPPFGVVESTSAQLLPINTTMGDLLSGDEEESTDDAEETQAPRREAMRIAREPASPPAVPANAPPDPDRITRAPPLEPESRRSPLVPILVVAALATAVGAWWLTRTGPAEPTPAPATAVQEPTTPTPAPASKAAVVAEDELPTDREAIAALPYARRHALLARQGTATTDIELHVGLDLLQAEQSPTPCETFSGALSTIEASADPSVYQWALADAHAPASTTGQACAGLAKRLSVLTTPADPAPTEDQNASARPRRSKPHRGGSPERKRTRDGAASPPAKAPPAADPPKAPPAKPKKRASVATKLDDDLRGLD